MCCGKMARIPNNKEKEMITTRQIKADIAKRAGKLGQATTKDVDASIPRVENPNPQKTAQVSTHNIADVADIAEKKRRDAIMAEKKEVSLKTEVLPFGENIEDDKGFNLQYAIVEIDELLQGVLRRELK